MATDEELLARLRSALDEGRREPPAHRVSALRAAAAEAEAERTTTTPTRAAATTTTTRTTPVGAHAEQDRRDPSAGDAGPGRRRRRLRVPGGRPLLAAAAALLVVLGAGLGLTRLRTGSGGPGSDEEGVLEFEGALVGPGGGADARATVRMTGIGRVIRLESDDLPILPTGEYYELWFVGPGDSPARHNRISAGTFHPDEDGRSSVQFAAAVNPRLYPKISVTAEPGDGDPAPNGPEVLRATVA